MKNSRLSLHAKLVCILGSRNVYFAPPEKTQLKYPCIVYSLSNVKNTHADNRAYSRNYTYNLTLITSDPENDFVDRIMELPYTTFDKHFQTQGLNHYVFTINYKNEKEIN